jgi:O-antigen ligase
VNQIRRNLFPALLAGFAGGPAVVTLAGATSPMLAAGLLLGGMVVVAMLMWPFYAFLLTVLTVPLERIGRLTNDSSQYTFSVMRMMGTICLASLFLHRVLTKTKIKFSVPMALYAIYVAFGVLSLTYTTDPHSGVRQASAMLGNLLFLFLIPNLVKSPRQVRIVLGIWLAISAAVGIFTIYGWHKGLTVTDSRFHSTGERSSDERFAVVLLDHAEFDLGQQIPRALGPTSHPAVYAINMIMTLPFYVLFYRTCRHWYWKLAVALGGLIAAYNILLTNTRAAVITAALVVLLSVVTGLIRVKPLTVAGLLVLCAISIPLMPRALTERIFDISNYTSARSATLNARFAYWRAALEVISEHPLLGVGLGNQSEIPRRITQFRLPPNSSVHNEYLNSLMEVGFIGYSFLAGFFVMLFRRCRKTERQFRNDPDSETRLTLVAARVLFWGTLYYAVQVDCFHFPLKGWWLVMGLVLVLYDYCQKPQPIFEDAPGQTSLTPAPQAA